MQRYHLVCRFRTTNKPRLWVPKQSWKSSVNHVMVQTLLGRCCKAHLHLSKSLKFWSTLTPRAGHSTIQTSVDNEAYSPSATNPPTVFGRKLHRTTTKLIAKPSHSHTSFDLALPQIAEQWKIICADGVTPSPRMPSIQLYLDVDGIPAITFSFSNSPTILTVSFESCAGHASPHDTPCQPRSHHDRKPNATHPTESSTTCKAR